MAQSTVVIDSFDKALFKRFVQKSNRKYNSYVNAGLAYTPMKGVIKINGQEVPTDTQNPDNKQWYWNNTIKIFNYYQTSFRDVVPNMDGTLHYGSQTYALVMISILGGVHNVPLYDVFNLATPIELQVNLLTADSSVSDLISSEAIEIFNQAFIVGYTKMHTTLNLAVRFAEHTYKYAQYDASNINHGSHAVTVDYTQLKMGKIEKTDKGQLV